MVVCQITGEEVVSPIKTLSFTLAMWIYIQLYGMHIDSVLFLHFEHFTRVLFSMDSSYLSYLWGEQRLGSPTQPSWLHHSQVTIFLLFFIAA
jgi:hypothetical protein